MDDRHATNELYIIGLVDVQINNQMKQQSAMTPTVMLFNNFTTGCISELRKVYIYIYI